MVSRTIFHLCQQALIGIVSKRAETIIFLTGNAGAIERPSFAAELAILPGILFYRAMIFWITKGAFRICSETVGVQYILDS